MKFKNSFYFLYYFTNDPALRTLNCLLWFWTFWFSALCFYMQEWWWLSRRVSTWAEAWSNKAGACLSFLIMFSCNYVLKDIVMSGFPTLLIFACCNVGMKRIGDDLNSWIEWQQPLDDVLAASLAGAMCFRPGTLEMTLLCLWFLWANITEQIMGLI